MFWTRLLSGIVFLFAETFEKRKLLVRMVYHDP